MRFDSTVTVTDMQHRRYNDFRGSYLSRKHAYRKTEHVTDVLLAYLLGLSLRRYSVPVMSGHGDSRKISEIDFVHGVLAEVSAIKQRSLKGGRRLTDEHRQMRAKSIQDIPDSFVNKKNLRGAQLEHVLLVRALSTILPPLTL